MMVETVRFNAKTNRWERRCLGLGGDPQMHRDRDALIRQAVGDLSMHAISFMEDSEIRVFEPGSRQFTTLRVSVSRVGRR